MAGRTNESPRKLYLCKICKVQVISPTNKKAIYGREHKKCCPRRNK